MTTCCYDCCGVQRCPCCPRDMRCRCTTCGYEPCPCGCCCRENPDETLDAFNRRCRFGVGCVDCCDPEKAEEIATADAEGKLQCYCLPPSCCINTETGERPFKACYELGDGVGCCALHCRDLSQSRYLLTFTAPTSRNSSAFPAAAAPS